MRTPGISVRHMYGTWHMNNARPRDQAQALHHRRGWGVSFRPSSLHPFFHPQCAIHTTAAAAAESITQVSVFVFSFKNMLQNAAPDTRIANCI